MSGEAKRALKTAEEAVAVARSKETLFWELQSQNALAAVLLRRGRSEDQFRIAEILDRADHLIEQTGGDVMKPVIAELRAQLAGLKGDNAGRRRMLQKAFDLYISMEAVGSAEQLAARLKAL